MVGPTAVTSADSSNSDDEVMVAVDSNVDGKADAEHMAKLQREVLAEQVGLTVRFACTTNGTDKAYFEVLENLIMGLPTSEPCCATPCALLVPWFVFCWHLAHVHGNRVSWCMVRSNMECGKQSSSQAHVAADGCKLSCCFHRREGATSCWISSK